MYPIVVVGICPLFPTEPTIPRDVVKVAQGRFELWPGSSAGLCWVHRVARPRSYLNLILST